MQRANRTVLACVAAVVLASCEKENPEQVDAAWVDAGALDATVDGLADARTSDDAATGFAPSPLDPTSIPTFDLSDISNVEQVRPAAPIS